MKSDIMHILYCLPEKNAIFNDDILECVCYFRDLSSQKIGKCSNAPFLISQI